MPLSIKQNAKWILRVFVLFVVASLSFGIGYLVAREKNPPPIVIEDCSTN